jgi:hypothetical protein
MAAFEAWGYQKRFGIVGLKDPEAFWFAASDLDFDGDGKLP